MDRLITRLRSSGLSWGNISSFDPATISREIIGVLLRLWPVVCVQGIAPHNHRGGGELTGIITRCCPSFPKIASISRERPRAPPSGSQLVRHGGSSREKEREGGGKREGRKRHRWSDKKEAHTPDQRETTDGPAECTCWNKGLANRRRRWKLKRTHARARTKTYTHR